MALYAFAFVLSSPVTAILSPDERREFLSITSAMGAVGHFDRRGSSSSARSRELTYYRRHDRRCRSGLRSDRQLRDRRRPVPRRRGVCDRTAVGGPVLGGRVDAGFSPCIIPSPPRGALLAALGSASAVPVVAGVAMAIAPAPVAITPLRFFLLDRPAVPGWSSSSRLRWRASDLSAWALELKRARHLGSYRSTSASDRAAWGSVARASSLPGAPGGGQADSG